MSIVLSLVGALVYGIADFLGGMAAARTRAVMVTAGSQVVGLVVLIPTVVVLGGRVSWAALLIGALAGVAGSLGVIAYYRGLAVGPMGVVSPIAAVVGAVVPLAAGLILGERLSVWAAGGIALAVVAILLASLGGAVTVSGGSGPRGGPLLGVVSGLGFGLFYVAVNAAPDDSGAWPLVGARCFVIAVVVPFALLQARARPVPGPFPWALVALTGVLDQVANVCFLLAVRGGALAVTGVLVSLYPVVVAVLAALVLKERLRPRHALAAGVAILASVMVAVAS